MRFWDYLVWVWAFIAVLILAFCVLPVHAMAQPGSRNPAHEQAAQAREPPAPAIDPRIAAPALEAMQATIKLRDAQLVVMSERVRQLEAELKDAQAQLAAPAAPPKPAE